MPLTANVALPVVLKKRASLDSAQAALGAREPGTLDLTFGPLLGWYRFWDCDVDDIDPPDLANRTDLPLLSDQWEIEVQKHEATLHAEALKRLKRGGTGTLLEVWGGSRDAGSPGRRCA
jgi:hypothetical protein